MIRQILVKTHSFVKTLFIGVAGLLIILIIVSFVKNTLKVYSAESKLEDAKAKLEAVKKEQIDLKKQLNYISSDFYKDKEARDKLGLVKDNEITVVLPDKDILRRLSPRQGEVAQNTLPDPNWKKWMSLFFKI